MILFRSDLVIEDVLVILFFLPRLLIFRSRLVDGLGPLVVHPQVLLEGGRVVGWSAGAERGRGEQLLSPVIDLLGLDFDLVLIPRGEGLLALLEIDLSVGIHTCVGNLITIRLGTGVVQWWVLILG